MRPLQSDWWHSPEFTQCSQCKQHETENFSVCSWMKHGVWQQRKPCHQSSDSFLVWPSYCYSMNAATTVNEFCGLFLLCILIYYQTSTVDEFRNTINSSVCFHCNGWALADECLCFSLMLFFFTSCQLLMYLIFEVQPEPDLHPHIQLGPEADLGEDYCACISLVFYV